MADLVPKNPKETSWHISAKSVTFDNKRRLYIAEDKVVLTGGKTRLEADYVEFSNKTKDAFARGNVLLISGEDSITCNAMTINLATETGTIKKGNIFVQKNNFHISGENIKKTGKFTYSAEKGSITSCSGDSPDWKITGKDINVTIGGHGTAKHTILWAKKVPTLYSPFLIFPVKTKRQTGLLIPRVGTSDRKGFEYEQPFFWAISDHMDATFYADHMSDRGTKAAAEFRYMLDKKTKGAVYLDFLEDDTIDDGTTDTDLYSYSSTPQRTNTDRFWFRLKHDHALSNGFTAKMDIDVVSDEDYLYEFKDGFTGYDEVKKYYEKHFGRSLDEYDDYTRKNWFNLTRSWSNYSFKVDTMWYDNVRARKQNTADTTLQTLPSFQFDASRQQIGSSKLYYSLDSEYTSFYRKDTTSTLVKGQRLDIHPKLYRPLKLGRYFHFEPFIGLRETAYHTNGYTDSNGDSSSFRTREMLDTGAELSTKIIRIYDQRVKHEIIPELEYSFVTHLAEDQRPTFDDIDTIGGENLVTWSVINNIITKKMKKNRHGGFDPEYREFAYLKLSQSFDIKKERQGQSEPFSNLSLETELYPHDYFSLDMDLEWSPYNSHFKSLHIGNTIKDNRGDSLRTEYRYDSSLNHTLFGRLDIQLTDRLCAYYSIERNLEDKKTVETQAGVSYKKSCWRFDLFFEEADGENSIAFLINLFGIGEFGTK